MNFQDFWNKLSFIFWRLCDEKTCEFVVMEIGKKVVWAEGGMGRGYQADGPQFLLVCAGRRVGWVGIIRYQMLL